MERGGFGQRDLLPCRALMRGKEAVLGAEAVGTFANHGLLDQRQFFVAQITLLFFFFRHGWCVFRLQEEKNQIPMDVIACVWSSLPSYPSNFPSNWGRCCLQRYSIRLG